MIHLRHAMSRSILVLTLVGPAAAPRLLAQQGEPWRRTSGSVPASSELAAPKPFDAVNRMITWSRADSVVALSREQLGFRYKLGAKAPGKAFDCSGLVQFVMEKFKITLPRTAREQAKVGYAVERDPQELQPGDLLTFGRGKRITHIGIYVGEGRFVHASNRRLGIIESPLPSVKGSKRDKFWKGVRRVLHLADPDSVPPPVQARRYEPGETPVVEGPAS